MSNPTPPTAARPQPSPVDLGGIDPRHAEHETTPALLSTAVAETATGVRGVHHLGGLAARTLDRAQRQLLGTSSAPGVTVSQDSGTTTIDLDIVTDYPHPLAEVVETTRTQVAHAAQQIIDGPVVINIVVTDVHGPFDSDPAVLDAIDDSGARAAALRDAAAEHLGDMRADASDAAAAVGSRVRDLAHDATKEADEIGRRAGEAAGELQDQIRSGNDTAPETAGPLHDDTPRSVQDPTRGGGDDVDSRAVAIPDDAPTPTRALDAAVDDAAQALDAAGRELEHVRAQVHPRPTDTHE